jgi:hypothetical protein
MHSLPIVSCAVVHGLTTLNYIRVAANITASILLCWNRMPCARVCRSSYAGQCFSQAEALLQWQDLCTHDQSEDPGGEARKADCDYIPLSDSTLVYDGSVGRFGCSIIRFFSFAMLKTYLSELYTLASCCATQGDVPTPADGCFCTIQ